MFYIVCQLNLIIEKKLPQGEILEFYEKISKNNLMRFNTKEAFRFCKKMARAHYENFPVASRFLAADKRKYVAAVYAFARTADDFSDERQDAAESLRLLAEWDAKLDAALSGMPEDPIFIAVKQTVEDCQIPLSLLHDLVSAFRMDVTKKRHRNYDELLHYCRYSANPVGRLVLLIHGYRDENFFLWSDAICTALQLANFWQDVSVDLKKNRIYLPQEILAKHGYSEKELFDGVYDDRFVALMKEVVATTRDLFYRGQPLIAALGKDLRFQIRLTWSGGMKILDKIEKIGYQVLRERPALNLVDKMSLLVRSAFGGAGQPIKGTASYASIS